MDLSVLTAAIVDEMADVLRWSGAIARRLRPYNIALNAKQSGNPQTDALTLADLTVQELIVAALRDTHPLFRQCRLEAEESTGDLSRFPAQAEYAIAIDPIDGTKKYRDKTGNGYAVMLHVRSRKVVHCSLVHFPEEGGQGSWLFAADDRVYVGDDDRERAAADVVRSLPPIDPALRRRSKRIYLIGFNTKDAAKASVLADAGFEVFNGDQMTGSIYPLLARGEFCGSLIHTPNVYDFPVSSQVARILGGDSVWVHDGRPVDFEHIWNDERSNMLRLPGIIATSTDHAALARLCEAARDWNPVRYAE